MFGKVLGFIVRVEFFFTFFEGETHGSPISLVGE
jgi:hypothetical protein